MAFTAPTWAEFTVSYPAFAATPEVAGQAALDYASTVVGANWSDEDGPLGIRYRAAHTLTLDGHGTGAQAAGYQASGIRSMKSGSLSIDFENNSSASLLATTSWGKRYLQLLRLYAGGPFVARAPFGTGSHLAQDLPYIAGGPGGRIWE